MNRCPSPSLAAFAAASLAASLAACEIGPDCASCPGPCTDVPASGVADLQARLAFDDYERATYSFEHATAEDSEAVRNDWDLLFGNDQHPDRDVFSVNTVTDDRSFIVDLGDRATFDTVPERVDPAEYPVGDFGRCDDIDVALGHLYLVRTVDSDTEQWAAFRVVEHELNARVRLLWARSPYPDRFALPER